LRAQVKIEAEGRVEARKWIPQADNMAKNKRTNTLPIRLFKLFSGK